MATLPSLHAWFSQLLSSGPVFGYLPQPAKTVLVASPSYVNQAASLFSNLGIKVVSGSRFLGGFVGERSMASDFVTQRVRPDQINFMFHGCSGSLFSTYRIKCKSRD